jgi:hypothetical protein
MTFPWMPLIGAAAVMAVVATLMRRGSVSDDDFVAPPEGARPPEPSGAVVVEDDGFEGLLDDDESEPDAATVLAVTSDGQVFMPMGADVRLLPLGDSHAVIASGQVRWEQVRDSILAGAKRSDGSGGMPGIQLDVADFSAGRVVRGAPDIDPWRLELLGLDGEYQPYAFETQDAATIALGMLERMQIIKRPLDDDGVPIPVPAEQYETARREFEDTFEELSNMPDVEQDEPGR